MTGAGTDQDYRGGRSQVPAVSARRPRPVQPVAVRSHPIIGGIDWAQAPLLLGYNSTKPKPTAEMLLVTERGEPLLASWRYGLGQAAAFTSDAKARWASEWLTWPGYGKFWGQVVRGLMRKSDRASFAVTTREKVDELEVRIDAVNPDGSFRNRLPITINALQADGTGHSAQAQQDAPGSYSATLPISAEGTTIFSLASPDLPDGGTTFGHTRSYPREFLNTGTNEPLLRRIAELGRGTFNPNPAAVWTPASLATPQRKDLTDYFLIAALALIPLDIWFRRRA